MSRNTRIALGLIIPSTIALIILVLIYPSVKVMETINPMIVALMLGFIITSVASSTFTAYFFKQMPFPRKTDLILIYLNAYPWIAFIFLFADRFWILSFPLLFTPLLGYWFGKRYFYL